jgi:hypothetical protein
MRAAPRPAARLEVRLLGSAPSAYVNDQPITLERRSWGLLILMLLAPELSFGDMRDRLASWDPDPAMDETPSTIYKAKSGLLRDLRAHGAGDWIEARYGFIRLAAVPEVDYCNLPSGIKAAFDYCVERGDLLPSYIGLEGVHDERERYHQRLQQIARQLIARQKSEGQVEALLEQARHILPEGLLKALHQERSSPIAVTSGFDIAATLHVLESHVNDGASERTDAARLEEVVNALERTAQDWRPTSHAYIERAAALVSVLASTDFLDLDDMYVKVANTYYLGNDLSRAVEFIRPWLRNPEASPNAFCTAALYNLPLGHIAEARDCFDYAHEESSSADFKLTVREKRDIQLRSLQGGVPSEALLAEAAAARNAPGYNDMSPGSRASIWCNAARAADGPLTALGLAKKGREIDKDTENPHYEFDLLRYARAAGKKRLAEQYEGEVKELLSVPRPSGFYLSQMGLRAEQLTMTFSDIPARDSPQYRARLGEADSLWEAIYQASRRTHNVPQMCRTLLRRADVAERSGAVHRAYEFATTAYVLGGRKKEDRLRYATEAQRLLQRLEPHLDATACKTYELNGESEAYPIRPPHPLLAPEAD